MFSPKHGTCQVPILNDIHYRSSSAEITIGFIWSTEWFSLAAYENVGFFFILEFVGFRRESRLLWNFRLIIFKVQDFSNLIKIFSERTHCFGINRSCHGIMELMIEVAIYGSIVLIYSLNFISSELQITGKNILRLKNKV